MPAPQAAPATDWLAAGWKFGLGLMAAVTVFAVLDGLVIYIVSTQGFHLNFNLAH